MNSLQARIVKQFPSIPGTRPFSLDLQFDLESGSLAIVGPSGSGKSSVLNCLAGFLTPDDGRIMRDGQIYFDRQSGVNLPPARRRCGYLFQEHALFPHMSVRQNIAFSAGDALGGKGRRSLHRRVSELLEQFALNELADRRPAALSGGEQQRAALARTLGADPKWLLLDEPSQGLDTATKLSFYRLVRDVRQRLAIPLILVSHQMDECFELAENLILLESGRVLQAGARDAVFEKPASIRAAELLGAFNVVETSISALDPGARLSRLRVLEQEIEGPYFGGHLLGDRGYVCIRRSAMKLQRTQKTGAASMLSLTVKEWQSTLNGIRIYFAGGFSADLLENELAEFDQQDFNPGKLLPFAIPKEAVTFLSQ